MKMLSFPLKDSDIDTRRKRRRAVKQIREQLDRIHFIEGIYWAKIPKNLRGGDATLNAEYAMDALERAMIELYDAYE
jgi:hypothetical protein